jgi:hypothetical protein
MCFGPNGDPKNMQTGAFFASGGNSGNVSSLQLKEMKHNKVRAQSNVEVIEQRICSS